MENLSTQETFEEKVLKSNKPVLVDFWAEWCMPCKNIEPILESVLKKFQDKLELVKVNVEKTPDIASKYMVMSIPALILFKEGRPQKKLIGLISEREIEKMVAPYLE